MANNPNQIPGQNASAMTSLYPSQFIEEMSTLNTVEFHSLTSSGQGLGNATLATELYQTSAINRHRPGTFPLTSSRSPQQQPQQQQLQQYQQLQPQQHQLQQYPQQQPQQHFQQERSSYHEYDPYSYSSNVSPQGYDQRMPPSQPSYDNPYYSTPSTQPPYPSSEYGMDGNNRTNPHTHSYNYTQSTLSVTPSIMQSEPPLDGLHRQSQLQTEMQTHAPPPIGFIMDRQCHFDLKTAHPSSSFPSSSMQTGTGIHPAPQTSHHHTGATNESRFPAPYDTHVRRGSAAFDSHVSGFHQNPHLPLPISVNSAVNTNPPGYPNYYDRNSYHNTRNNALQNVSPHASTLNVPFESSDLSSAENAGMSVGPKYELSSTNTGLFVSSSPSSRNQNQIQYRPPHLKTSSLYPTTANPQLEAFHPSSSSNQDQTQAFFHAHPSNPNEISFQFQQNSGPPYPQYQQQTPIENQFSQEQEYLSFDAVGNEYFGYDHLVANVPSHDSSNTVQSVIVDPIHQSQFQNVEDDSKITKPEVNCL